MPPLWCGEAEQPARRNASGARRLDHWRFRTADGQQVLKSDGGLRHDGSAALGFVVLEATLNANYAYRTLWRSGVLLNGVSSAFEAEALALEAGVEYIALFAS